MTFNFKLLIVKNILIIGGSSGIGKALVEKLKNNYNIISTYKSNQQTDATNVCYHEFDVKTDSMSDIPLPDVIHGLVYCPGSINLKPFHRYSEDEIIEDIKLNVTGFLKVLQEVRKSLLKSEQASIVLFSSVAASLGFPFHTQVSISKGAIEALAKTLAAELAPKVRVNVVAPSITLTPLSEHLLNNEKKIENSIARHPLKKIGDVNDIVNMVSFLIDDKSQWITGQTLKVDGGISNLKI